MKKILNPHNLHLREVWRDIKKRTRNKKHRQYPDYGKRGIDICDEWANSFKTFYSDMIKGYKEGLTIDRIDNHKGYFKKNCRWITRKQQARNRRSNVIFKKEHGVDASSRLGLCRSTVNERVRRGWDKEKAFNSSNMKSLKYYKGEDSRTASIRLGGNRGLISMRLKRGWSMKEAFTTPVRNHEDI